MTDFAFVVAACGALGVFLLVIWLGWERADDPRRCTHPLKFAIYDGWVPTRCGLCGAYPLATPTEGTSQRRTPRGDPWR